MMLIIYQLSCMATFQAKILLWGFPLIFFHPSDGFQRHYNDLLAGSNKIVLFTSWLTIAC